MLARAIVAAAALMMAASCGLEGFDGLDLEPEGSCRWVADCMLRHCPAAPRETGAQWIAHAEGCADVCIGLAGRPEDHRDWYIDLWACETGLNPGHSACEQMQDDCDD